MRFEWPEFGRCCFCMPLRRGILTCAYIRLIIDILLVTAFSIAVHQQYGTSGKVLLYTGVIALSMEAEMCIALTVLDIIFVALLLYGSHMKQTPYMKAFYYYGITSTLGAVLLELIQVFLSRYWYYQIDLLLLSFIGVVIQVYLLSMIRSLLTKLERSGPHHYDNQLHEVVLNNTSKSTNDIKSDGAVDV